MKRIEFGFKDLRVWQKAMDFADEVLQTTESLNTKNRHYRLVEQIEAAVTSIAANIAEGKGRESQKEFIRFLYIARGSLYETITLLNIFKNRNWISEDKLRPLEEQAFELAGMIKSLINSIYKNLS